MTRNERVYLKSHLTLRPKSRADRNKQTPNILRPLQNILPQENKYYVIFGSYKQNSMHPGIYFIKFFKGIDERNQPLEPIEFEKSEFCGLEVGCAKKHSRWLWAKERNRTFLRLFFTSRGTLEFFIDSGETNPLEAFRTIEAWRRKLSKELGYRCYWNVFMRATGTDWEEGYGKLHFTDSRLAIVSTDKRPQTLGHWPLSNATHCSCVARNVLQIKFQNVNSSLLFESEDAGEIARTLAMNMTSLEKQPLYQPFPIQDQPPARKRPRDRKSVRNKHKPPEPDSEEDVNDAGLTPSSPHLLPTPDTEVPLCPDFAVAQPTDDLVSLGSLDLRQDLPAYDSPPAKMDDPPPTYDDAAGVNPYLFVERHEGHTLSVIESSPIARALPERSPALEPTSLHRQHIGGGIHKGKPHLTIDTHLVVGQTTDSAVRPTPSPRYRRDQGGTNHEHTPPPRPPKSPLISNHGNQPNLVAPTVQPRTPDPRLEHPLPPDDPPGRRPVPTPRPRVNERLALTRQKSKSTGCLRESNDWQVNQQVGVGFRVLSPVRRDRESRKTIRKSIEQRRVSMLSDDDIKHTSYDKDEIYDVSNILNHLSNHRDDRSFRVSTMWYVNMLSTVEKPPPLPPRDPIEPTRPPNVQPDEYWSAMMICHTLRRVLIKDAPLPDTLKLPGSLRNKVCMMLYINNLGVKDWRDLAETIGLEYQAVELIEAFTMHHNQQTSAEIVLRHWQFCYNRYGYDAEKCRRVCNKQELMNILRGMHRMDIIREIEDVMK